MKAEERQAMLMTEQQLRALRKKHLLVLVRDLERDLKIAVSEKEQILLAYQCGQEQARQDNRIHTEYQRENAGQVTSPYIDSNRPDWQQSCTPSEILRDVWQQQAAQPPYAQYSQPQWQQAQTYQQPYTQQYTQQQPYYWPDPKPYGT